MAQQTFLWHFQERIFPSEYTLTKELFYKSYVRDIEEEDNKIIIIDNDSKISNFYHKRPAIKKYFHYFRVKKKKNSKWWIRKSKIIHKRIKSTKIWKDKLHIGASTNLEYRFLKHKFWNELQLEVPVIPNVKGADITRFSKSRNRFFDKNYNKKGKLLPVHILKPIKKGYVVSFSNLKGFLPMKQFLMAKKAMWLKEQKLWKKNMILLKENLIEDGLTTNQKGKLLYSIKSWRKYTKSNPIAIKSFQRLPLKLDKFKFLTKIKRRTFVKKRRLGARRKFFYKRKRWNKWPYIFKSRRVKRTIKRTKKNKIKNITTLNFFYKTESKKYIKKNLSKTTIQKKEGKKIKSFKPKTRKPITARKIFNKRTKLSKVSKTVDKKKKTLLETNLTSKFERLMKTALKKIKVTPSEELNSTIPSSKMDCEYWFKKMFKFFRKKKVLKFKTLKLKNGTILKIPIRKKKRKLNQPSKPLNNIKKQNEKKINVNNRMKIQNSETLVDSKAINQNNFKKKNYYNKKNKKKKNN